MPRAWSAAPPTVTCWKPPAAALIDRMVRDSWLGVPPPEMKTVSPACSRVPAATWKLFPPVIGAVVVSRMLPISDAYIGRFPVTPSAVVLIASMMRSASSAPRRSASGPDTVATPDTPATAVTENGSVYMTTSVLSSANAEKSAAASALILKANAAAMSPSVETLVPSTSSPTMTVYTEADPVFTVTCHVSPACATPPKATSALYV
ncbi:hypothetical protein ES703_110729 [subsurface metagenome]